MHGSRNFCHGGPGPKTALTTFFFCCLALNLFYSLQERSNGFITKKTIRLGPTFFGEGAPASSGGGGGVQMLISIEPHIICDFPGGVRTPIPPLDPHMNRGAVKTDRNRSLTMRTDKHAYAEF